MLRHEFGILEAVEEGEEYSYDPPKYNCISLDDEIISSSIIELKLMKTYHHELNRPDFGLAYYGITLIPPESLKHFQNTLLKDKKHKDEPEQNELIALISEAIEKDKFVIHFGI